MKAKQQTENESEVATGLVGRILDGDRSAETELVQRYWDRLRYVLLRKMPLQRDEVEDVLQSTFALVLEQLRSKAIAEPSRLGGYIFGVARNTMHASYRQQARFQSEVDSEGVEQIPEKAPAPDDLISINATTQLIRELLADLGNTKGREVYAEVLIRYYIEQQTRDEICEALNLTPKGFRNALHRAKLRLKELALKAGVSFELNGDD